MKYVSAAFVEASPYSGVFSITEMWGIAVGSDISFALASAG
jgi:hypothetical protein